MGKQYYIATVIANNTDTTNYPLKDFPLSKNIVYIDGISSRVSIYVSHSSYLVYLWDVAYYDFKFSKSALSASSTSYC